MGIERDKIIYLLMTIILYSVPYAHGSCEMTEMPKSGVCNAMLICDQVIEVNTKTWDCIKTVEQYLANPYSRYSQQYYNERITYATDYMLYVTIENVDDGHNIFQSISNKMSNIKTLHINHGTISNVPQQVYQLSKAIEIEISNNQVTSVNLNSFVAMTVLKKIDLHNNIINTLEMDTQTNSASSRSIDTVDLSQNELTSIPNIYFSHFTELRHLNLSHNRIQSFDTLTFEGVIELRTLDVSYNLLFGIESFLFRFIKLNELYIQNNKVTYLKDYSLNALVSLKRLNVSSNTLSMIENNTFKNLLDMEDLDMRNNSLDVIKSQYFKNNMKLKSLIISNNNIKHFEDCVFDGKNVTEFQMKGNQIAGTINKDTFKGIHVKILDLSEERLTSLGNESFKYMFEDLISLNMSFNNISFISDTAFSDLKFLTSLDLSHNNLEELNFETSDLKELSYFNLSSNVIREINNQTFHELNSLNTLDLSYNEISKIQALSFVALKNVKTLRISHNPFVNTLENNTFQGLVALENIDLSYMRTTTYKNESFSGLSSLKKIYSTFGQLSTVAFNAFSQTGSIVTLDFSHNLLKTFHINTTTITTVQELYLNNNALTHITNYTFSGLKLLRILNLADNDIKKVEVDALRNLGELNFLFFSSNMQMEILGNPFENLSNLNIVKMDNVKTRFTFANANVTTIQNLNLKSCAIRDLNKLFIFKVKQLRVLDLSANDIMIIDKLSFQRMYFLVDLDLSSNMISSIQPGSFKHVNGLKKINLFSNNLQALQFGVFDGMINLHFVNLSNNALQSLDVKLIPAAKTIALDNNNIKDLNFKDFFESDIDKLSIGGNQISCKVLVNLKTSNYSKIFAEAIKTATLDFHSENVDGISCQGIEQKNGIVFPVINNTSYDIRPIFAQLTNAIEMLRSSIEIVEKNTSLEINNQIQTDVTQIVNSVQTLVNILNNTRTSNYDFIKHVIENTNRTNIFLQNINGLLANITNNTRYFRLNNENVQVPSNNSNVEDSLYINSEIKMIKDEMYALQEEMRHSLQINKNSNQLYQSVNRESRDEKVLYFIAICLGLIIILYVINLGYAFVIKGRRLNSLRSSTRPIAGEMEME